MDNLPLTSIIVPVYNGEKVISECIESLLNQDYPKNKYEIIIVDNNSKDKTSEIIKKYPVRYLLEDKIQGPSAARNAGAREAKGEILAFFDSDQIADKSWLKNLLQGWEDKKFGAFGGKNIAFVSKNNLIGDYWNQEENSKQEVVSKDNPYLKIGTGNAAYRKDVFKKLEGFDNTFLSLEDFDICIRMQKQLHLAVKYNYDAVMYHKERLTIKSLLKREFCYGIGSCLLGKKHMEVRKSILIIVFGVIKRTLLGFFALCYGMIKPLKGKNRNRHLQLILLDIAMRWANCFGRLHGKFKLDKYFFKVAVISSGLDHVKRGVETWAKDLAYALKEKGINVRLYKGSGASKNGFERSIACVRCGSNLSKRLLKMLPRFSWHFGMGSDFQIQQTTFTLNLLPELMLKRFDIIHTQDPDCANILRIAKKIGLIRSKIILAHGTEEPFGFIKKFDYLQHLAPYHMEEAMQNGVNGTTKQFAIGNFVDTERFDIQRNTHDARLSTPLRCELKIPEEAFIVLSAAAIKKTHKRIDYLIDEVVSAGSRLVPTSSGLARTVLSEYSSSERSEPRSIYLVIAGAMTKETDELVKMGKDKLGERIIFLTDFPRERMNEVYAMADVFALCSLKEMMPIAVLEAISSGVPVIGHKYPVIEWMIGNGGECIDMAKEGELAKTIEKYTDETYRKEKSLKAREHAVKNFSKDVVVEKIVGMYKEALKGV